MSRGGSSDRWRGALLGTALGDALGAPFEGHRTVSTSEVEAWAGDHAPLTWTDDTAMTIGLARSLVANGGRVDPQHLGDTFAAAYRDEPWRGYGSGPPTIFAAAEQGTPYAEAAAALFGGSGSFGNGAAMRAAPAAVVGGADLDRVAAIARDQARVTHSHPLAQDGAVAVAIAVAQGGTDPSGDPPDLLPSLLPHLTTAKMRAAVQDAGALAGVADVGQVARRLGNGVAALASVPAALAAFLTAPDDPTGVLLRAVTTGGDTDTIAAMAGAMVGARVGAERLPAALLARLESRDVLVELADQLAGLA